MTLRIREIVIRADISEDAPTGNGTVDDTAGDRNIIPEAGAMTRNFYEEDFIEDNER